jgi:H2-forming N5,N10-methylenetetrahydromethanopterin dehydrogenase-like enzyme
MRVFKDKENLHHLVMTKDETLELIQRLAVSAREQRRSIGVSSFSMAAIGTTEEHVDYPSTLIVHIREPL